MATADFRRQLEGVGLTTANILYRMPDHPDILQNFIWQHHDLHPHFPELKKFLDFWTRELDGLGDCGVWRHASHMEELVRAESKQVGQVGVQSRQAAAHPVPDHRVEPVPAAQHPV